MERYLLTRDELRILLERARSGEAPPDLVEEVRHRAMGLHRPPSLPRCECCRRRAWQWARKGPFRALVVDGERHHVHPDGLRLLCGAPLVTHGELGGTVTAS